MARLATGVFAGLVHGFIRGFENDPFPWLPGLPKRPTPRQAGDALWTYLRGTGTRELHQLLVEGLVVGGGRPWSGEIRRFLPQLGHHQLAEMTPEEAAREMVAMMVVTAAIRRRPRLVRLAEERERDDAA